MDEKSISINNKTSILLSRNAPVVLVVGAAGFLGSNLVDRLLEKGIQVVGVDDFSTGRKENIRDALRSKNFHLISESAQNLTLELPRLDYLIIVAGGEWDISSVLKLFKEYKCRCLFVSAIELYDKDKIEDTLLYFRETESKIAKFAAEFKLNARVLRLGSVYGPRMHFRSHDSEIKLIQEALSGDLQKGVSLEFSSRALYVLDAVDLMIKTILSGATAQKLFDGVLPAPIKVSEIKQVLLDPIWYETRDFVPSELPPWPTPNLEKTIKFLNWKPKVGFVESLRKTLSYFKDNEIHVPKLEARSLSVEDKSKEDRGWKIEKREQLEAFKIENEEGMLKTKARKGIRLPKFSINLKIFYFLFALTIISYGLIWPIVGLSWGILTFRFQLLEAVRNLEKGNFDKSLDNIQQANFGVEEAKAIFDSVQLIRRSGVLRNQFELGDNLSNLASLSTTSAQATIIGIHALYQGFKAVTGEITEAPADYFTTAQVQLAEADQDLSKAYALLNNPDFNTNLPGIFKSSVNSLAERLAVYTKLVKKARALSVLIPEAVALEGQKNYLILLQNNNELRPGGGFIGSFAKVSFEGGKLKKLAVNDVYAIDGQLNLHVEPPKEIKEDLGQNDWHLRDSNWESDFPTAARQAEWFYTKETGERVEGVLALDVSAMEDLLSVVGPLDLPDYNEKISSDNLFAKAITHAEVSFFPGSQAKKSFLTALTNQLFNKIFFLPGQSWPGIVSALGRSLEEKHMSIYLDDPKLFSYLVSQNWTSALPRPSLKKTEDLQDFLAPVEANLGANKANYYLDRNYNLETVVGKNGEINHRLRIAYTNRSPSDAFPAGKYKNRMRIYLPFGTKLNRALWGEKDITKEVESFVDYGRSGYSFLLLLAPKEEKTLVLDYQEASKLEFKGGIASYRLDVVKQAGTLKDPFAWKISYPISYSIVSAQTKMLGPQEQTISTDLSTNRSFAIEFKK